MTNQEIKALISLLEDDDNEILTHVEDKLSALGELAIPFLEDEWASNLNPKLQNRIESLIKRLQLDAVSLRLQEWVDNYQNDLLRGMWAIASYQYPTLSLEDLRKDFEQIYYEVWRKFQPDLAPSDEVRMLNAIIFGYLQFGANNQNFHSPSNSMINVVLETRKGNPIALCIVYMLIAQKLGMPVFGVNLPNLFVLTYKSPDKTFYINAFSRGLIFSRGEIDSYIAQLNLPQKEIFYEPCTNLDIVKRVLRNLMLSFEQLGERNEIADLEKLMRILI